MGALIRRLGFLLVLTATVVVITSNALAMVSNVQVSPTVTMKRTTYGLAQLQADGTLKVTVKFDCQVGHDYSVTMEVSQGKGSKTALGSSYTAFTCAPGLVPLLQDSVWTEQIELAVSRDAAPFQPGSAWGGITFTEFLTFPGGGGVILMPQQDLALWIAE